MILYGDKKSGNCLKALWVAERLGFEFEWRDVDVTSGVTREPEFLAINPAGQVPTLVLGDGRSLAQSNAIMLFLANGSDLIPDDPYARGQMFEWLFWEQYSHEPVIAVRRFQKAYLNKPDSEIDPALLPKGHKALALMEGRLTGRDWFAGDQLTLADIALLAYTRLAPEGGFDLADYEAVRGWIGRCERELGL